MFEVQELDALTEVDEKLWLTIIDTDNRPRQTDEGPLNSGRYRNRGKVSPNKNEKTAGSTPAVYC